MLFIILLAISYFIGSLSSAIIVCKIMKLPDPREHGSNNPGATNVMRIGGKKASYLTFLGDFLKGFLPVIITQLILKDSTLTVAVAMGAFLGHLYPVYFGFKGGKGVATLVGIIVAINPFIFLIFGLIWLALLYVTGFVSLASIVATATTIFSSLLLNQPNIIVLLFATVTILIIYRHKANIKKLLKGEESSFKNKKTKTNKSESL